MGNICSSTLTSIARLRTGRKSSRARYVPSFSCHSFNPIICKFFGTLQITIQDHIATISGGLFKRDPRKTVVYYIGILVFNLFCNSWRAPAQIHVTHNRTVTSAMAPGILAPPNTEELLSEALDVPDAVFKPSFCAGRLPVCSSRVITLRSAFTRRE